MLPIILFVVKCFKKTNFLFSDPPVLKERMIVVVKCMPKTKLSCSKRKMPDALQFFDSC